MGMYDTINGEQVKAFPIPYISNNRPCTSCGNLRGWGNESPVPYKTMWYNYSPNFLILDLHGSLFGDNEILIHVVTDGKVEKTICLNIHDIESNFPIIYQDGQNVMDYYGERIDVHTNDGLRQFILDTIEYDLEKGPIAKKYSKETNEVLRKLKTEISEEKQKELIERLDILHNEYQSAMDLVGRDLKQWYVPWCPEKVETLGYYLGVVQNKRNGTGGAGTTKADLLAGIEPYLKYLDEYSRWMDVDSQEVESLIAWLKIPDES